MKIKIFFLSALFLPIAHCFARSIHRPVDPRMPEVSICWSETPAQKTTIKDSHIEFNPIFSFDYQHFMQHKLPPNKINYPENNPTQYVSTHTIDKMIEDLLIEIAHKKRKFKNFTIIKKRNFSFKKRCGLIILAFNNYPLILKLFMETPRTFFDCHAKGVESVCFFYMSGGANRHVTGLTRIKNREYLLKQAQALPAWKQRIKIPRKWFWLPNNASWLLLEGKNIGETPVVKIKIPAVYAIIADFITIKPSRTNHSKTILQLCNDLNLFVDAHKDNFVFNQKENGIDDEVIIIDTEHFPSVVGLKEKFAVSSHFEWYLLLITKCINDCYLRHKTNWFYAQHEPHALTL